MFPAMSKASPCPGLRWLRPAAWFAQRAVLLLIAVDPGWQRQGLLPYMLLLTGSFYEKVLAFTRASSFAEAKNPDTCCLNPGHAPSSFFIQFDASSMPLP